MKPLKKYLAAALLAALSGLATVPQAQAQVSGTRIGGCNIHIALSPGQIALAAALSTTGSDMRVPVAYGDMRGHVRTCAAGMRHHICADEVLAELLFNRLDPTINPTLGVSSGRSEVIKGAVVGAIGLGLLEKTFGGSGMVGAVLGGSAGAVVGGALSGSACASKLDRLAPVAQAIFGSARFNADYLQPQDVTSVIQQAAQRRIVSSEDAQALSNYVVAVSNRVLSWR